MSLAKRVDNYETRDKQEVCYWKSAEGTWLIHLPHNGGTLGDLRNHTVVEHEDSTISVTPSILITAPHIQPVHGYLTHGEWKDC
jgi:hypothetical protein